MTLLFTLEGSVAAPAEAVKELAAASPRLSMLLIATMGAPYWAVFERWREDDPRRARVRAGELLEEDARDMLRTFTSGVKADEVIAWVRANYGERRVANPDSEATKIVQQAMVNNKKARKAQVESFVEESEQRHKDDTSHQRRLVAGDGTAHPMVAGFGKGTIHDVKIEVVPK